MSQEGIDIKMDDGLDGDDSCLNDSGDLSNQRHNDGNVDTDFAVNGGIWY